MDINSLSYSYNWKIATITVFILNSLRGERSHPLKLNFLLTRSRRNFIGIIGKGTKLINKFYLHCDQNTMKMMAAIAANFPLRSMASILFTVHSSSTQTRTTNNTITGKYCTNPYLNHFKKNSIFEVRTCQKNWIHTKFVLVFECRTVTWNKRKSIWIFGTMCNVLCKFCVQNLCQIIIILSDRSYLKYLSYRSTTETRK